jgi:hypothetical protein
MEQHAEMDRRSDEPPRCPFCEITNLPRLGEDGVHAYVKHVGHHMEEIAFGVVSTAYENWSYDESGSDPESTNLFDLYSKEFEDWSSLRNCKELNPDWVSAPNDKQFEDWFLPLQNDPVRYDQCMQGPEDLIYEKKYWTEEITPASPASSANSGLRDPYPADYLSAASAGSNSHLIPQKKSPTTKNPAASRTKRDTKGEQRVRRRKGPLKPEQRQQAREIRKLRACLRCKFLKKTCDRRDPCSGCQPSHARLWIIPCTRLAIKDFGYFLKDWKADYDTHHTLDFLTGNIKGYSSTEQVVFATHGYGHFLPVSAREFYLQEDCSLVVDSLEAQLLETGNRANRHFEVNTARLSAGVKGFSPAIMIEYIDRHIDQGFEDFVDAHFEGTPFLTECLKTTYRYMSRDQSAILRKALRLVVAYNLTLNLTMMEPQSPYDGIGHIAGPGTKLFGKTAAPVMINFQVKYCLAAIWRDYHRGLLEELDSLITSVYSGEKLKHWGTIFFVTLILLSVWEEMQFDCHYRIPDEEVRRKFCLDMERIPVGALLGLFFAISQKVPRFEDWGRHAYDILKLNPNDALYDALNEMRDHVIKYGKSNFQTLTGIAR